MLETLSPEPVSILVGAIVGGIFPIAISLYVRGSIRLRRALRDQNILVDFWLSLEVRETILAEEAKTESEREKHRANANTYLYCARQLEDSLVSHSVKVSP